MKKIVVSLLVISLLGLSYVQYRFLIIGLRLTKAQFDRQIGPALQTMNSELYQEHELTHLLSTVVSANPSNFTLGLDTVREASVFFLRDYLTDRLLRQNVSIDFAFAIKDFKTNKIYLQSEDFKPGDYDNNYYNIPIQGVIAQECDCSPYLVLEMRNLLQHLLFQLNNLTIPSLIFLGFIVFCFVWLIWLLMRKKKLDEVKNDFINNLTHEIKTPVFSISLATKMLEEVTSLDQVRKYAALIRMENGKLKTHVEKVLELASLESDYRVMELKEQDVHQVITSIAHYFEERVRQQGGKLYFQLDAHPSTAAIDAAHFSNAILNLLDNALKYSHDKVNISIRTYYREGKIHIAIQDEGTGIKKQNHKQVFSKFYRVQNGDVHHVKGFGLGLSYVQQVVNRHKGKVMVESELGKGSTFTIVIPAVNKLKMTLT